jgi:hypothetical protein
LPAAVACFLFIVGVFALLRCSGGMLKISVLAKFASLNLPAFEDFLLGKVTDLIVKVAGNPRNHPVLVN